MVKNPERIIDLLSTSLPSQATYFMQIIFAATFLLQAIEMLRLYPLGCAVLRRFVGPRATAKERKKPWLYIYTLEEPPEFWHAETFAQIQILYIMVLLVYAVIAPFVSSLNCSRSPSAIADAHPLFLCRPRAHSFSALFCSKPDTGTNLSTTTQLPLIPEESFGLPLSSLCWPRSSLPN
jgi:hypothetical protein